MKQQYIFHRRRNHILDWEALLFAIVGSIGLKFWIGFHCSLMIVTMIAMVVLFHYVFFHFRFLRYLISIAFSLGWSSLGASLGSALNQQTDTTMWVFGILAFLVSLYLHKEQFDFEKNVEEIDYDKY